MTIWRCKQKSYTKTDICYKLNHGKEQKFLETPSKNEIRWPFDVVNRKVIQRQISEINLIMERNKSS